MFKENVNGSNCKNLINKLMISNARKLCGTQCAYNKEKPNFVKNTNLVVDYVVVFEQLT